MRPLLYFVWLTLSLASSVDGFFLFNRKDPASGVEYTDVSYWIFSSKLRPALERLEPDLRIWLDGVGADKLDSANGFTQIAGDGNRYRLLRRLIRSRILRWIVILAILKVAAGLFVIVVLPNIYFMSMMMME